MARWNDDEAQRRLEALAALEGTTLPAMNLTGADAYSSPKPPTRLTLPTIDLSTPEARAAFEANGYSQPQAAKLQTATAPATMPRGDDLGIPDAVAMRQRPAAPAQAAPVDAYADAEEADRKAHNRRVLETAGRQLLSGLTRTPQQDVLAQPGTAVQGAKAAERQSRLDALKELEAQTQAGFLDLKRNPAAKGAAPIDPLALERGQLTNEKLRAEIAKLRAPPKGSGKGSATPAAPDEVPFGDDVFVYGGAADVPKDVRLVGAKAVREKASQWNTALAGMDSLEEALTEFVNNPSLANKSKLYAPALSAAGAVNAAIGQGAMSEAEKQAQFQALGINSADPASLSAWVERAFGDDAKARNEMLTRVRGAKSLAKRSVANAAQPYGYKPRGAPRSAAPAGGTGRKVVRNPKTGERRYLNADGSLGEAVP